MMMAKVAFVFPGQGSQSVGMGKDFFEQSETAKNIYEAFNRIVDSKLSDVCFNGPEEELRRTLYTQPAILATSLAALTLLREKTNLTPVAVAGHSLGEYAALYASGVIDLETAAKLVQKRSELMEQAPKGAMAAVLNLDADKIEAVIKQTSEQSGKVLTIANYNTDAQVVISGEPEAVEAVMEPLKTAGAKRVMPLPVGGAFHSPLMNNAAETFGRFVQDFEFNNPVVPVVTNVDASATTSGPECQSKLGKQINHSVRWTQSMAVMVNDLGIDTVIEIGPGKVLGGMFKKSHPHVTVHHVFDVASLSELLSALQPA